MRKIVITYGLISGAIVATLILLSIPLWNSGILTFDNGEVTGYTTMVIALSVIFFAIKSYRDKHSNGIITFWKGVQIGLLITLIAAVMYALAWEISLANMSEDFITKMTEHMYDEMRSGGATDAEVQEARDQWASFMEYYKYAVIRIPITMMEILPVGIIITLISAALMRRKEFLPATETASA